MLPAILQCIVRPLPPTMMQLKTSVEPRLRNHGGETKNTTSSRHSVTTDRARMPQTLATFCGNMRSTLDTGNLGVWRRAWGHQHRSPLSDAGQPNGVEPTGKEGSQRRDSHKADRQLPDRT